jgi:hypothetical protein
LADAAIREETGELSWTLAAEGKLRLSGTSVELNKVVEATVVPQNCTVDESDTVPGPTAVRTEVAVLMAALVLSEEDTEATIWELRRAARGPLRGSRVPSLSTADVCTKACAPYEES